MFSERSLSCITFNVSRGIRGYPNGVCGGREGELPSGCARRQNSDPTIVLGDQGWYDSDHGVSHRYAKQVALFKLPHPPSQGASPVLLANGPYQQTSQYWGWCLVARLNHSLVDLLYNTKHPFCPNTCTSRILLYSICTIRVLCTTLDATCYSSLDAGISS